MKMQTMFKLSAVALALVAAGQANAGVLGATYTAPTYATEVFGSALTAASPVTLPSVTAVTTATGALANAANTLKIQLSAGETFNTQTAPVLTLPGTVTQTGGAITFANSAGAALIPSVAQTGTAAAVASNADVMFIPLNTGTTAVTATGTLVTTIAGLKVHAATLATPTLLASAPTATITMLPGAITTVAGANAVAPTDASTAIPTAASLKAYNVAIAAGATATVDVNATPSRQKYLQGGVTNLTAIPLGTVTVTNAAATADATGVAASYALTARQLGLTVNAAAGFFGGLGTTKKLWLEAGACTAGAASALAGTPSALLTGTTASTTASVALGTSTTIPVSATPYNVCMEVDALSVLNAGNPTITGFVGASPAATAQDSNDTIASTALAVVNTNGQTKTLTTYIPAAVAGYTALVRVVNTGAVAAAVNLSVTNEAGVTTAAATPVVASLAAGATANLTAAQIETNLATPANFTAASRPRVTISSPTSGMVVQSFVVTPNGALTEVSGQAAQ